MAIAIVRIPGHPTKSAAQDTLTIMQAGDGYIQGSVYREGSTWTAEASFETPDPKAAVKKALAAAPSTKKTAKKNKKKKSKKKKSKKKG